MADAFGMRSVAMRYKGISLKIHTPALTRIADQRTRTNRLRNSPLYSIGIRLRAVEPQWDRDVDWENVSHSLFALYADLHLSNIDHDLLQINLAGIIYALANVHQQCILRIPLSLGFGIGHILTECDHRIF